MSGENSAPHDRCAPALVVGVGDPLRGDDGVGIAVVEAMREKAPEGVDLLAWARSPTDLIDLWQGREVVILVDAVRSGGPPGVLHRFDVRAKPLPPEAFHVSSHSVGLAETLELARLLDRLPRRVLVFGVEGQRFGFGPTLTRAVREQVAVIAERILEEVLPGAGGGRLVRARGEPCA